VSRPTLAAHRRDVTGKHTSRLRTEGILPAVVFGHNHASESVQVDAKEFSALQKVAGRHALVDLKVDGGRVRPVMIHGVQEHPIRRVPIHVDFYLVKMTEEMTVDVPLVPTGGSVLVEKHDGTLLQSIDHVRVRALPADLPPEIHYDISHLETWDAVVHVRDLVLPPKITVLNDLAEPVAHVAQPRVEEAPAAGEPAAEAAAPTETAPAPEG
jgi:large subunit ribosomal protein L25